MNDHELDRLLDTWSAPAPTPSLRDGLRARLPRAERIGFGRPLRWALALLVASVALAIATLAVGEAAQTSDTYTDLPIVRFVNHVYESFVEAREARRVVSIVAKIRQSDPKVYLDGRMTTLEYGPAATINVPASEGGVYSISLYRYAQIRMADGRPTGWVEAGHVHANVIEIQVRSSQVRIECNQLIVDTDRPVFVMYRP